MDAVYLKKWEDLDLEKIKPLTVKYWQKSKLIYKLLEHYKITDEIVRLEKQCLAAYHKDWDKLITVSPQSHFLYGDRLGQRRFGPLRALMAQVGDAIAGISNKNDFDVVLTKIAEGNRDRDSRDVVMAASIKNFITIELKKQLGKYNEAKLATEVNITKIISQTQKHIKLLSRVSYLVVKTYDDIMLCLNIIRGPMEIIASKDGNFDTSISLISEIKKVNVELFHLVHDREIETRYTPYFGVGIPPFCESLYDFRSAYDEEIEDQISEAYEYLKNMAEEDRHGPIERSHPDVLMLVANNILIAVQHWSGRLAKSKQSAEDFLGALRHLI